MTSLGETFDVPPIRKTLGIAVVVVAVIVILEIVGVGPMARSAGSAVVTQVKSFFARLSSKPASGT